MKRIIVISVFLILIILLIFRIFVVKNEEDDNVIDSTDFSDYDVKKYTNISYSAELLECTIHQNYLTIKGTLNNVKNILLDCDVQSISDIYFEVCLKGITNEIKYDLSYDLNKNDNDMNFESSNSICLDNIPIGNYLVLLKLNYKTKNNELNEDVNYCYLSFEPQYEKEDLDYQGSNNTIAIKYDSQDKIDFLSLYASNANR